MGASAIHLDLSELVRDPMRTGIQRVERNAISHWPGRARLIPCCVSANGEILELADDVLKIVCAIDDDSPVSRARERTLLGEAVARGRPIGPSRIQRLLNLELFFDPVRADTHIHLAAGGVPVLWYLYDFLPFLRPELFPQGTVRHCMHFLRALRGVGTRLAFLSEQTRNDYNTRIRRRSSPVAAAPIIHPGADGLGLEQQAFSTEKRDYISIGTIEPRKNPLALLQAFEVLWSKGSDIRLILAGRIAQEAVAERKIINARRDDPRLVVLETPSDERIRSAMRGARAVIMPSEAEGFGLPPYEAVFAGVPAIASARLPSASMFARGAILLERMVPTTIAEAVMSLQDDQCAEQIWTRAANLRLPTWAAFGNSLGDWVCNS